MMYYHKKQSGFSLVETLVAISILLIVIVGPMGISMQTAKSSTFATEQIQAFFLAQEGMELAQKARDDIMLKYTQFGVGSVNNPWSQFTDIAGTYLNCFNGAGCGLEWDNSVAGALETVTSCSNPDDCRIYRETSGRDWFGHSSAGVATPFTRRIYFSVAGLDPTREVKVRSVVTWRTGSLVAEQKVEVESYLYNIYATP